MLTDTHTHGQTESTTVTLAAHSRRGLKQSYSKKDHGFAELARDEPNALRGMMP